MAFNVDYNEIGQMVVEGLKNSLEQQGLKDSRIYNDIEYKASENGVSISMPSYSVYIEKGRSPNSKFPPPQPIQQWIKRKGITPRNGITQKQLTFVISKHIAENGIKPRPFIAPALNQLRKDIEETIAYSVELYVATALREKIKIK
jgi:hypothetical protein